MGFLKALAVAGFIGLSAAATTSAMAQENYPSQPVTLIITFAPGGGNDVVGRMFADKIGPALGQPIVVENRAGGGGTTGAAHAAKQKPDGYTILMANGASHLIGPVLFPDVGYDPVKSFDHAGLLGEQYVLLVVNAKSKYQSFKDLVDEARTSERGIKYGLASAASINTVFANRMTKTTGARFAPVIYNGGAPALTALAGGEIEVMISAYSEAAPHIQSGAVRPIAISSTKRIGALPDVPTFAELGYEALNMRNWYGIETPAGTPKEVIGKLNEAIRKAGSDPELIQKLNQIGFVPTPTTPEDYASFLAEQVATWRTEVEAIKPGK
ncbi:MAG: tripartite tricarboxylate transporter substrate binding protein [Rhizobiaceae bacterium]